MNTPNTSHLDTQIAAMDAIALDKNESPRLRLLALQKKSLLLKEKAELLERGMISNLSEINLGFVNHNGLYS